MGIWTSDRRDATAPTEDVSHACRFWGLIGDHYPEGLIADHLRDGLPLSLKILGGGYRDGWGFAAYLADPNRNLLEGPLIRRGGPPANDPNEPEYDLAVAELARLRPRAAVGHVRLGSSGHWGVPNPHPFQHEGMVFGHNGTLPTETLEQVLLSGDPTYLVTHPPDWINGYIDSELYFLFLLKVLHENPALRRAEGLRLAVERLAEVAGQYRLNFVLTDGDTLYALRHAPFDSWDPVVYCPAPDSLGQDLVIPTWWAISSQIIGSSPLPWAPIPDRTLGVFVPGQRPRFLPINRGKKRWGLDGGMDLHREDPTPQSSPALVEGGSAARGGAALEETVVADPWPNPARDGCVIRLFTPLSGVPADLEIFDAGGRSLRQVRLEAVHTGENILRWDGRDALGQTVARGQYYARIRVAGATWERKITVLR